MVWNHVSIESYVLSMLLFKVYEILFDLDTFSWFEKGVQFRLFLLHENNKINSFSPSLFYFVFMATETAEDDMTSFLGRWEQLERTNVEELTKVFGN